MTLQEKVIRESENILIEVNESGVVAVYGDVTDTTLLNLISPAIVHLDQTIQDLQSFVSSEAFKNTVHDAATKLAAESESTAA